MAYTYHDLAKKTAPIGLSAIGWLIASEEIETFGELNSTNATTAGANAVVDTDHEPFTGKGFMKIYHNADISNLNAETVGDRDSERIVTKCEIMVPGNDADLAEFAKEVLSKDYILLLKEPSCAAGATIQVGTECNGARLRPKFQSGTATGGSKGWTFEVEAREQFLFYTGTVTLIP